MSSNESNHLQTSPEAEAEMDANSRVDALAILGIVVVLVGLVIFYVSR